MQEFCDEVVIVDAGSRDGTVEVLKSLENEKTKIIYLDREEWDSLHGWAKLNHFSNKAISELTAEWNFYQQSDEVVHEKCYKAIREAVDYGTAEAYLVSRINLWNTPYQMLNVQGNRNPCSTQVTRLAKSQYMTYGDAESIAAIASSAYLNKIRLYHFGFVRSKKVHCDKIRNMQANIFEVGVDAKLEGMTTFDPTKWFSEADLLPVPESLPNIMERWCLERM
jgi:glycosyltransferase involved in cell wall biosynthesis